MTNDIFTDLFECDDYLGVTDTTATDMVGQLLESVIDDQAVDNGALAPEEELNL